MRWPLVASTFFYRGRTRRRAPSAVPHAVRENTAHRGHDLGRPLRDEGKRCSGRMLSGLGGAFAPPPLARDVAHHARHIPAYARAPKVRGRLGPPPRPSQMRCAPFALHARCACSGRGVGARLCRGVCTPAPPLPLCGVHCPLRGQKMAPAKRGSFVAPATLAGRAPAPLYSRLSHPSGRVPMLVPCKFLWSVGGCFGCSWLSVWVYICRGLPHIVKCTTNKCKFVLFRSFIALYWLFLFYFSLLLGLFFCIVYINSNQYRWGCRGD